LFSVPKEIISDEADVTQLLLQWRSGHKGAPDQLMPIIYSKAKLIARAHLVAERPDHTLNTTTLIHEAYLKMVDFNRIQRHDIGRSQCRS